jgi:uncharacterized membrane protein affecting hemolysin expression
MPLTINKLPEIAEEIIYNKLSIGYFKLTKYSPTPQKIINKNTNIIYIMLLIGAKIEI